MNETPSRIPRILVAALIIVAAGVAGFLGYRASQPRALTAVPAHARPKAPAPEGAQPAQDPNAAPKKVVPDRLPNFTLADRNGKPTAIASFGGRPLMVNFWATWCAPCRREIPLLNRLHAERRAQNAQIVGIAVDFREDVLKFTQKTPIDYALLIGEEEGLAASEAFGMGMMLPFSVFVDSQNRILAVKVGELHEDEANFAFDRLLDLDQGLLTQDQAQSAVANAFRDMATARARKTAPTQEAAK